MTAEFKPKISLIIPSYNEANDIKGTSDSGSEIDYDNKEVIVVDDSIDETYRILQAYSQKYPIKLYRQSEMKGLNGAYNLGIKQASGEIIFLLTADNRPLPDFVNRVLEHYKNGADYVLVSSSVINVDHLYPSLISGLHRLKYDNIENIPLWSEGFSARKNALFAVNLFPENYNIMGGTDNYLSMKLGEQKFKKAYDASIVMPHIAPSMLSEFWHQQVGRGVAGPQFNYAIAGHNRCYILLKVCTKVLWYSLKMITVFPLLRIAIRVKPYSKFNLFKLYLALNVIYSAQILGEIIGVKSIVAAGNARRDLLAKINPNMMGSQTRTIK